MTEPALFNIDTATAKDAGISPCGTYRYWLTRHWADGPLLGWIMLNPSTADAEHDDPTIRRCIGFARAWGYAGIMVRNLYALRATDPAALWNHPDPVGPDNDLHLRRSAESPLTVCAWGNHGSRNDRSRTIVSMLAGFGVRLRCLKTTSTGEPWHPLYVAASVLPIAFPAPSSGSGTEAHDKEDGDGE
ncbi:MAG TPA: DUF1643 domain-containing protein [Pseudonocardiaceae bacterium]|jgi:hypothetical protein|nr:DUF1643 domain-containing protein [Pseudonocardiaceae bacterium]